MADSTSRILIVDDHPLICHALTDLISRQPGLQVCGTADDVRDALTQVEAARPDLAIVDISLKTGNGLDLTKRIRARHPQVKVLVLSLHDESLFAQRALHAGAAGYVNKQQANEQLLEAIAQVLDGRIYLSAAMTDNVLHRAAGTQPHRSPADALSVESLTDREMQVFELSGQGLTTRQIAERLHVSLKTIESHRDHIRGKLNVRTGAELVRHAVQWVLENH